MLHTQVLQVQPVVKYKDVAHVSCASSPFPQLLTYTIIGKTFFFFPLSWLDF